MMVMVLLALSADSESTGVVLSPTERAWLTITVHYARVCGSCIGCRLTLGVVTTYPCPASKWARRTLSLAGNTEEIGQ